MIKAIQTSQIFRDLKAYKFEKEPKQGDDEPKSAALVADQQPSTSSRSNSNSSDF